MAETKTVKTRKKATKPITVAVPPVQRLDFLVSGSSDANLNCKTALLFPDAAPLTDQAVVGPDRRAKAVAKRKDKTESTTLDLQAVWAHVTKPPADGAAVLVFLHGHVTFVTIDKAGDCEWPSWADIDYPAKTDPKGSGPKCAAKGYKVVESAMRYKGSVIALAPENARPYVSRIKGEGKPTKYIGTIAGKLIFNQAGTLLKADGLGNMVVECLQRLTKVKAAPDRPQCPKPPLSSVPNITRLFLSGHSGAYLGGLFSSARSQMAKDKPTDLILLDCFYGDGRAAVQEFIDSAKGGLGNGPGQSRVILVHDPASYGPGEDQFPALKAALTARHKGKTADVRPKAGKTAEETVKNALPMARDAMLKNPIVFISGSLGHFSIPGDFMPLVLETAPQP